MVSYDPISALEKREAEKEQSYKRLKVSILLGAMSFVVILFTLFVKG